MTQNTTMVILNMTEDENLEIERLEVFTPIGGDRNKLLGLIRHDTPSVSKKKMVKNASEFAQLCDQMAAKIRPELNGVVDLYVAVQFSEPFIAHVRMPDVDNVNRLCVPTHVRSQRVIYYGPVGP